MNALRGSIFGCNAFPIAAFLVACAATLFNPITRGDDAEDTEKANIAAIVNGEPVFVAEVEYELNRVLQDRPVQARTRRLLQAKTLDQLISRRLIVQWLAQQGRGASKSEVERELSRLTKRLQRRETTLQEHLDKSGMTEQQLHRLTEWQIGWQRFLDRYLTEENLKQFFKRNRRAFDGTRMRVAHILLNADEGNRRDIEALVTKAATLAEAIQSGKLAFDEAARRHSAAPTAADGGEIGFIQRHQPMPESFSRAAFALKEGEVSVPVVTPFGVHLIRCLEIKPGQKRWQDVRAELVRAVTEYLFEWAAGRMRPDAEIEFTGALPHFEPGTETLAK